jgi:Family of unknown function (DUF5723)
MRMKSHFLLYLLLFCCFSVFSQQQMAMRMERRSGLYATTINPAALSFTPSRWEVSLFSADFFTNQNYGYVQNASVQEVLRNPDLLVLLEDLAAEPGVPTASKLPVDFYKNGRAFGVVQSRVSGPGFSFRINQQHSLGLSASGRFLLSSYRIPNFLRYKNVSKLDYGKTYKIEPIKIAALAWGEIAGHYAYRNFDGDVLFAAGITPKFITGIQSFYGSVNAGFNYTPIVADTISVGSASWDFGFTNDALYADDPTNYRPKTNGYGGGLDVGVSWAMPLDDPDRPEDYQWRVGVSIIDLGFVHLNKNAETHRIDFNQLTLLSGDTIQNAANISPEAAVKEFSNQSLGDPDQSKTGSAFTVGLSTMFSVQFDYAIRPKLYVQGYFTQRLPMYRHALKAPNTLAIVPRYEQKWFSVSVPVVWSDYSVPRIGFGARLGVFYFGSDDVLSWTGKNALTGTDAYVGLKINDFQLRAKQHKRHKNRRHIFNGGLREKDRRWKDVGCWNQ